MTWRGTVLAVVAWTQAMAAGPQQPATPFTATTNLVVVPAVVLDKRGQPVTGLTVNDFQVREDGAPMAIEAFVAPDAAGAGADGRLIVLVLDNLNTAVELGARVRRIATMFVDRMTPADTLSVITLEAGRAFTTANPKELRAQIDRFRPSFGETIRSPGQIANSGLQAIRDLSAQLGVAPHRRKALVFIGSAGLFSPADPSAFDDRGPDLGGPWFDAVRETARSNVSVYAIDPVGFTGTVNGYVEGFAEETGGQAYSNASNFGKAVDEVWRDTGTYYLLGYSAPINDHRVHDIDVSVRKPGVTVRARRGPRLMRPTGPTRG